jgi:hypothetical protein
LVDGEAIKAPRVCKFGIVYDNGLFESTLYVITPQVRTAATNDNAPKRSRASAPVLRCCIYNLLADVVNNRLRYVR